MIKRLPLLLVVGFTILALAGCVTTPTPIAPGELPTNPPPAATNTPIPTAIPPTETPSAVPPTSTPTALPKNVIQHFPTGQNFTVTDIHMVDGNVGWSIGGISTVGDHVLVTSDGGNTWKDVTPPETVDISNTQQVAVGYFQDARIAWVTYANSAGFPVPKQPVVWHTADGGSLWQASQPLDITQLSELFTPSDLQFVDGQNGWLLVHVGVGMNHDYVVIYRSNDGGANWKRILDPYGDGGIQSCTKTAMLFTDATHGWLTGDCHGVKAGVLLFNSADAGSTWQGVNLPAPQGKPNLYVENANQACGSYDPFFFSGGVGYLSVTCADYSGKPVIYGYYLYTTKDGGSSWAGAAYPGNSLYFFSANTGWAPSNKLNQTTDGGKTWKAITDITWTPQFDFVSEQTGWAVVTAGSQMALVRTDNGGAHWSELTPTVGP